LVQGWLRHQEKWTRSFEGAATPPQLSSPEEGNFASLLKNLAKKTRSDKIVRQQNTKGTKRHSLFCAFWCPFVLFVFVAMTLLDLLNQAPGSNTAVILPETGMRVSYDSLRRQVAKAADTFRSAGIEPGDRISTVLPNSLEALVCFLAAAIAGTAAPLNPVYCYDEFAFYLDDTSAKLLIVPPGTADEARRAGGDRIPILEVDLDENGFVRLSPSPAGKAAGEPGPDDFALVLHTSGTTGRPKRVPLRHRNLCVSTQNIAQTYKLEAADVALTVMPLFHVHGLVASALSTLLTGGAVVLPQKFNPLAFWRTVREHRATWYSAVPTSHRLLLHRAGKERPSGTEHLRFIRSCSAPLSPPTMRKLEEAFGVPVLEAYGMTEASHQMASNPLPPGIRKAGSVGQGTGVQIRIIDGTGKFLPTGKSGEVVIKGPSVIDGYENNPEANALCFLDRWFKTGDQGVLDAEGYLKLQARIKELIIRGGEKISPREIQDVLFSHHAVGEAVCFGVPHATWGEEVAAAVVLRESVNVSELLAHCRDHLAEFKCPKKIHVVDAIPRTTTGKIQRRALAAHFADKVERDL
jgi:acyl-CoA synthetase (AMP-forming)/AMP-acid ligase II